MNAPVKWNSSASKEVAIVARPKWLEVRQGLLLAVVGYFLLLLLGAPAPLFFSTAGEDLAMDMGLSPDDAAELGWLSLGLAGVLGYGLVLLGQWRCLIYAPQAHGAKELLFAGLLCTLMTPVCLLASRVFQSFDVEVLIAVGLLQVTTVVLALLSALLFTASAQAVTRSLRNRPSRDAVPFYWTVGFMGGGTIGVYLLSKLYFLPETRVALIVCWALCLIWHAILIHRAARYVGQAMRRPQGEVVKSAPVKPGELGPVALRTASHIGSDVPAPTDAYSVEIVDALFRPRPPDEMIH